MYYYGYKLHAVCGIGGVIHSYDLTAASVHDLHYLKDVRWEYHDCLMLGDKGYLSAEVQKNLFETANIRLEVPYRLNQNNCDKWDSLHHLNLIVELEDAFDMEFEPEEIAEMKSVAAVKKVIESKQA